MPKMKTNRGAAKRFKKTSSGKIKRKKAYLRHCLSNKSREQKRRLRKPAFVAANDRKKVERLLPYS